MSCNTVDEWIDEQLKDYSITTKFKLDDPVKFKDILKNKEIIGVVFQVDPDGVFEDSGEPYYDIYEPLEDIIYKHVKQSNLEKL